MCLSASPRVMPKRRAIAYVVVNLLARARSTKLRSGGTASISRFGAQCRVERRVTIVPEQNLCQTEMLSWKTGWQHDANQVTIDQVVTVAFLTDYTAGTKAVPLSHHDITWRCYFRTPFHLVYVVPGHLDRDRIVQAAQLTLRAFPALGARASLSAPPPKLDIARPSFEISFASWPQGNATNSQDQYNWAGAAETHSEMPEPPAFATELQVTQAAHGESPIFGMQVTHMGDGNTLLAVSWVHFLSNANPMQNVVLALAAAYRGDPSGDLVPSPFVWRNLWPNQLRLPDYDTTDPEKLAELVPFKEDLLAPGMYDMADEANHEWMQTPFLLQHKGPRNVLLTVALHQEDLRALKAKLESHPSTAQLPFFSTNDVVVGLAWMLRNDARGLDRPSQGPAGSSRQAFLIIDPATCPDNGIPASANPPGFLGNNACAAFMSVASDGTRHLPPQRDESSSLMESLARIVAACRKAILERRKPGGCLEAWLSMEPMTPAEAYKGMMADMEEKGVDALFTNMDTFPNKENLHFGTGPVLPPNGHFGVQRIKSLPIVQRPEGKGLRMTVYEADVPRLVHSPVLSKLMPASGLVKGILRE